MKRFKKILKILRKLISNALGDLYQIEKGIDWSKRDIFDGIGRPDLKPKLLEKCNNCDSKFKYAASGSCVYCYIHGYHELDNNE